MKKIFYTGMIIVMSMSILVGCGDKNEEVKSQNSTLVDFQEVSAKTEVNTYELSGNSTEDKMANKAREYAKYYLGVEMGKEFEVKVNEEGHIVLFGNTKNKKLFTVVYLNEDISLQSVFTTIKTGELGDNSQEKQKKAALEFLVEKKLIKSKKDVTFVESEKQEGFTNYFFKNKDGKEMGVGVSTRNCDVVALWRF
ncbi:MAG: hypothetical protein ACRC76_01335 [Proteocatella sp.]